MLRVRNHDVVTKNLEFSCMGHFTGHGKIAIIHATRRRNENHQHTFILLDMYKFSMIKFKLSFYLNCDINGSYSVYGRTILQWDTCSHYSNFVIDCSIALLFVSKFNGVLFMQ